MSHASYHFSWASCVLKHLISFYPVGKSAYCKVRGRPAWSNAPDQHVESKRSFVRLDWNSGPVVNLHVRIWRICLCNRNGSALPSSHITVNNGWQKINETREKRCQTVKSWDNHLKICEHKVRQCQIHMPKFYCKGIVRKCILTVLFQRLIFRHFSKFQNIKNGKAIRKRS